jgi:hypothetical protein
MHRWILVLLTTSTLIGVFQILPSHSQADERQVPISHASTTTLHADFLLQSPLTVPPAAKADKPPSLLDDSVNRWKQALASEPDFDQWKQASWSSYTLGPGTHGWVVILETDGKEIGYMIIHAAESGELRLTEYGTGTSPLFSLTTLYHSLLQLELIPDTISFDDFKHVKNVEWERWYFGSLQGLWKVTTDHITYVLDAKTGEALPLKTLPDPSDESLAHEGLEALKGALKKNPKLTYVTERYKGKVTCAMAVRGYRKWGQDDPYLIVDQNGARYIPLNSAMTYGHIYP